MSIVRDPTGFIVPVRLRQEPPPSRRTAAPRRAWGTAIGWLGLVLGLLLPAGAASAAGAHWYAAPATAVPPGVDGNDCASPATPCTIQGAINAAATYDTVHVAAGDHAFAGNRIVIDKEGLTLVGDHSPFAAPYGNGPGEIAPGTPGNKAANASVLKAATAAAPGGSASGMVWVRDARNVRIENLYIEVNGSRAKEAIVASGYVHGLQVVGNYIKITGGTTAIAIGINVNGTSDSSVPMSETRRSGQFVTLDGNVVEPTASPLAAPKRAVAMENQVGLVARNQLAGTTQDLWIQYATANASAPAAERLLTVDGNWFFGKLQVYLSNGSGQSGPVRIRDNHFLRYGSTFSPPGLPSLNLGNGSEAHSLRVMNANATGTVIEGNEFKGFAGSYRAVWVQNRAGVTIQDNVFTPDPGKDDFTAILVGNRDVWNGISAPAPFGVTILRNTFHANGASATNKAKAILFVDDNDPAGTAPGGPLQVGDGTLANANQFDAGIRWYIALDDRSCNAINHTGSGCNGTSSYAIGEGVAYSSGSNATSQKRPFRWDVAAAGNVFGGVFMDDMDQAQYDAVRAKTFDDHNKVQGAATVGNVVYGWTPPPPPPDIALTIDQDAGNDHRTGTLQAFTLSAANAGGPGTVRGRITVSRVDGGTIPQRASGDGSDAALDALQVGTAYGLAALERSADAQRVTLEWPPFDVPLAGGDALSPQAISTLFRVPGDYHVRAEVFDVAAPTTVYGSAEFVHAVRQELAVALAGATSVEYDGAAHPLSFSVSPAANPAVADLGSVVALAYDGGPAPVDAGTYAVTAFALDGDYIAQLAPVSHTVTPAPAVIEWGPLQFAYSGSAHAVGAAVVPANTALAPIPCTVTPPSVGPAVGSTPLTADCGLPSNYAVAGSSTATAVIGGANQVRRTHADGSGEAFFASVADALGDAGTVDGDVLELAPGVHAGAIVLTRAVKLVGSAGYLPPAFAPLAGAPGPADPNPPAIIDGGGAAGDGITIAPGVQGAVVSHVEVRGFGRHCIAANGANHGLVVEQSVIHDCGARGISVAGSGGIDDVVIDHNEVRATGDRGIVVWDGIKRDITITDNWVHDLTGCCGIELQDGSATGALVTGNRVENTGDSGMGFIQLTSGSPSGRPNEIAGNTINNAARFGIELKIPNGTGADGGDGAILVHDNIVDGGGVKNLRDRAGIAVIRRAFGVYPYQVDATRGVVVRDNTVGGFRTASGDFEGYGIVVEGTAMSVSGNAVAGNDIGLQVQQGNPDSLPTPYDADPGDADQDAHSPWFGRGNTATSCVDLGSNDYLGGAANTLDQRFQALPAAAPMVGGGIENTRTHQRYCSINAAIAAAEDGDTIAIEAGVHAENVVVARPVTLVGAKAGVDAGANGTRDGSGAGETILVPATAEPGISLASYAQAVVRIDADDVTLDGIVVDTDNPSIDSGIDLNGAGPDVSGGIYANGNRITLTNLVVRNAIYAGIDGGYDNRPPQDGNVISRSRLRNCDGSSYGIGIALEQDFYAEVLDNRMDGVRTGIQLDFNHRAAPSAGYEPVLAGNRIEARRTGIWANLFYGAAATYRVENNIVVAAPGGSGPWTGIWVESMLDAQTIVLQSNTLDGSAAAPGRTRVGYLLNNITSSAAAATAIDGGGVGHVDIGVLATDATRYTGPVADFLVQGVTFLDVATGAFYVEDTTQTPGSARLTIGAGNLYDDVAHELVLSGATPTAGGTVNEVFVRSARDFVLGAPVSSLGSPACAVNAAAPYCPVANASVNAGIAAVAGGGTVVVESGTFDENVVAAKAVALHGPHAGTPGDDGARGSGEAVIAPASGIALKIGASNVAVRGLQFGPATGTRVVEITNPAATLTGVAFEHNRIVDFTSTASTGGALFVSGSASVPATNGLVIAGNLFQDLANGPTSGNYAMGIKVSRNANMVIADNVFRRVQSNAMQLAHADHADVHGNAVEGGAADYTNVGIQVTYGNDVAISDNRFSGTLQAFLFNANSGPGVSFACNEVTDGSIGVRGASFGTSGPTISPAVFHNDVRATTALRNDDLAGGIVVGSNYYGGGAPASSGAVLAAAPLAASPIGAAECGDNAPVAIVARAGTPQSVEVGQTFADLRVRVQDALGGAVAGQSVAFAAPASGASALLGTPNGSTDHDGEFSTSAVANTTAGSYVVAAGSGALAPASFALANTQGTATVDVASATVTYDGGPHALAVATDPVGLEGDVQVVYTQGATTVATCAAGAPGCGPVGAGSYTATATIVGNPNYAGSGSGTLVIEPAATTIEFQPDPLSFVYDGTVHAASARLAAEPATACAVSGSIGPDVGSYAVAAAACSGSNYVAPAANALASVTPRPATITLSHLVQPYDGTPKSVVATTSPAGLPVAIRYDGAALAPSAIGSHAVHADIVDPNHAGSADATLQIVTSNGDIALVLHGPVEAVHVGETAQYAATMLANPALHAGETFGYHIVLAKSGGTPLVPGDLASMEVYYAGAWVDASTYFGAIPFTMDGDGNLVYWFPDGVPGYESGFPIEDPGWTWNFRFRFATPGTYTTIATLVDGLTRLPVSPDVAATIATVVQPALPPTDIHLVLGGPADSIEVGTPAEYTGTLLADPALHAGESFFVRVRIGKSGGSHALVPGDLAALQIHYGGSWQPLPDGSFEQPGGPGGDLVYVFPRDQLPGGFPIEDAQWTWNFRFTFADTGTYTASADVVRADDIDGDALASAAIATHVVAATVVPPTMHLVLLGPVDEVQAHEPAEYSGTLVADPAQASGHAYWVRVRLSKNGGSDAMAATDLEKMELHDGSAWFDATDALQPLLEADGNDLVYYFPQPYGAFEITSTVWSWHFRFTYAAAGVYAAVADVIDADDLPPLAATPLAQAGLSTTVVPQQPHIAIALQGPVSGRVGDALEYTGSLEADPLPDSSNLYFVHVRLGKDGGAMPMTAADLARTEISLDGGATWSDYTGLLPFVVDGNVLTYDFPQPALPGGFPIDGPWSWHFRFTYADAGTYGAEATVVSADGSATPASNTAAIQTAIAPRIPEIGLQLQGPVAGVVVGQPAQYVGTLTADPLPDPSERYFVQVRLHKSGGAMSPADLARMEILLGAGWVDPVADLGLALPFEIDGADLVYRFPQPVLPDGFPIDEPSWSWQFRFTYADAATYTATAQVVRAADLGAVSDPVAISTTVAPQPPAVSLQLNGPVAGVEVDEPAAYIGRLVNTGAALAENAFVRVRITLDAGALDPADLVVEVLAGGDWIAGSAAVDGGGGLVADFPDASGFPIDAGFDYTHQFRITYRRPGVFSAGAEVVGAESGETYASAGMYTQVVPHGDVTVQVLFDPASLHAVYDGQPHAASATTVPAGLPVTFAYDGSFSAPTGAGSYVVVADVDQPPHVGSASAVLVIDKAPSTVTIAAADLHQFANATHPVAASASPVGSGHVDVTYDGSPLLPTAPGVYTVVATLVDPNYAGSASASLVVDEGGAVVLSIDDAPAMALVGADAPYTGFVDYLGSIANAGATTAQAVHYRISVARIDDGNGPAGLPMSIAADDVLVCIHDPSGWNAQEPGDHVNCPQDYESLLYSQSSGALNGRPAQVFRYPVNPANDIALLPLPATPLPPAKFQFRPGEYRVQVDVVGADGSTVYASATATTSVPAASVAYAGPTSGQAEDALLTATRLRNTGGRVVGNVIVRITLGDDDGGALAPADAEFAYQLGGGYATLPWTPSGGELVTWFGPGAGFELRDGHDATTAGRAIFHREGRYRVTWDVLDADTHAVLFTTTAVEPVTIGPNLVNFALSDLHQAYDGSPRAVTVAPAGVPHAVTYAAAPDGSCPSAALPATLAPTDAGTYCVEVEALAPYQGSAQGLLVVDKAVATVTLDDDDGVADGTVHRTYDGSEQVVGASSAPPVAQIVVTYDGDPTPPRDAGTYFVVASIVDANHAGSASGTLVVAANGGASIVLDGASGGIVTRTYDGTPQAVTATTTPAGLAYAVTYAGDGATAYPPTTTPPTNAGQYHVVATTTDPNHAPVSASGTLVIAPANGGAAIVLDDAVAGVITRTYDGNAQVVTATTTPAGLAHAIEYAGSGATAYGPTAVPPIHAGSYVVSATVTDPNYSGVATTATLLVQVQAGATVTFDQTAFVYDGQAHSPQASMPGDANVSCGYAYEQGGVPLAGAPVAAGSYVVTATCAGTDTTGTASTAFTIARAVGTVSFGATNFTFDGVAHATTAAITEEPSTACTLANSGDYPRLHAGVTSLVASCEGVNYVAGGGTTLMVSPRAATLALAGLGTFAYDGLPHAAGVDVAGEVAGFPAVTVVTYNGASTAPTAVGSYNVIAALDAAVTDYVATPASGLIVIGAQDATVTLGALAATYDGAPHAASVTTDPPGLSTSVTYDGSPLPPSAAGSYTVIAVVTEAGYSGSASATLVIARAPATVVLGDLSPTYDGLPHAASVTTDPPGLSTSATYDGNPLAPTDAGSYAVVATVTDPNYSGAASGTLTIARAGATVTIDPADLQQSFGSTHAVGVTTSPAGLATSVTYDGSATVPVEVGTYSVVATITDANHAGSASATLVVSSGTAQAIAANGATSFSGTAGQPLAGALPSVRVTDAGGHPVAGVTVTFAADAASGTLSGATQATGPDGIATLGGWILGANPGTNTVVAGAAGVTGSVTFTAQGDAVAGAIGVTLDAQRSVTQVGRELGYTITVGNGGSAIASGVRIIDALPPQLDASTAHWQCIAVNGAICTASGSGGIDDTVDLPAGGSVVYLLGATVIGEDAEGRVRNTLEVDHGSKTIVRNADTLVVLFRDGFEPGGDGAQPWPDGVHAVPLGTLGATALTLAVDADRLAAGHATLLAQAVDGTFRVEAIRIGEAVLLRLVVRSAERETVTAWGALGDDAAVALVLEGRRLALVGPSGDLVADLPRGGSFAVAGVARR